MSIWFRDDLTLDQLNQQCENTLVSHMKIEMSELGPDTLSGTMPVTPETHQPFGIMHGGASCVLAESLGSFAANLVLDSSKEHAVGLNIQTNHIKSVRNGTVTGIASPIHIGRTTHIWNIDISNSAGKLVSKTTLTMAIIRKL